MTMHNFTEGKITPQIFKFAIPMLIGSIFEQLYEVIDALIVGKFVGKEALGAVGASFPIIFSLISLMIGIAIGTTIIIAQLYGARQYENIRKAIDTLLIFIFIASAFVTVFGIIFSEQIFRLIQLPEDIIPYAKEYFNIYICGLIFFFGFSGIGAVLRGLGDSRTPLYFLIMSSILNIILDILFVAGFNWGIAGAAWATVIAQAATFIVAVIYLNRTHSIVKIHFIKLKFDKKIFKKSMSIGLPTGLQQTFVGIGMVTIISIVNGFGTNAIAAYSAAVIIDSFASIPAMTFASALATFVGQNIGAKKPERVNKGFISTLKVTFIVTVIISILIIVLRSWLVGMFTVDKDVIEIGSNYLMIVGAFYTVFTTIFIVGAVMRGAGDTLIPMFITLFSLWLIRIPLAIYFSGKIGVTGIWWSIPVGWSFGALLSFLYYKTGRWKRKAIIEN